MKHANPLGHLHGLCTQWWLLCGLCVRGSQIQGIDADEILAAVASPMASSLSSYSKMASSLACDDGGLHLGIDRGRIL